MKAVFLESQKLEKEIQNHLQLPDFIMMENAALSLKNFILRIAEKNNIFNPKVLILCGKGNNAGDGFALARLLYQNSQIFIYYPTKPTSIQAKTHFNICQKLNILNNKIPNKPDIIVDCLFGTGFHGTMEEPYSTLIHKINKINCIKIACDIPSGICKDGTIALDNKNNLCCFNADYTISMANYKLNFYSDNAKNFLGKIIIANIGIPDSYFDNQIPSISQKPDAFLITKEDIKLPKRKNPSCHKGTFGHTVVYSGQKSGAAILSATASMNFGSGLTSLLKTSNSNLEQFKISPSLMICNEIPKKTTCIVLGPGIQTLKKEQISEFSKWFKTTKNSTAVIDASLFENKILLQELISLSKKKDSKLIFTPHLSEFSKLCQNLNQIDSSLNIFPQDYAISTLQNNITKKIELAKKVTSVYKNLCLVIKSSNTFICYNNQIYIISLNAQNLAKGGSGDILSGMIGSLLSQGYTSLDASITSCYLHALIANKYGAESFDFSPEKFLELLKNDSTF